MKQSGLGDNLYIGGYNVSGDIGSLKRIGGGPAALEVTGIDKSAYERIAGLFDGSLEYTSFFNPAAGAVHEVLSALPTTSPILTFCRGTTLGKPAASLMALQVNYDGKREDEGAYTHDTESQASGGIPLEWGDQLTAGIRTDTAATNGTGVDLTASTDFGLQAYLHVFAFTGTSATIKLQESSDDDAADAYADVTGGAFTTVSTAHLAERIATATDLTVERYLRVVTTGTFSELLFSVMVVKNVTAVEYA